MQNETHGAAYRWEKSTSHGKQKNLVWYRHAKRNLKVVGAPFSTGKARARALSSEPGTAVTGGARPE